jgi:voltage-gated potassium channel
MVGTRHLIISLSISILILALGTIGYMTIEGWPFIDALYMTVITISTVGFKEVNQIDGAGRIFTILLVFFGVGFTLYVAAAIVQFMVEGRIRIIMGRRRLDKKIDRLKNHYIVCGYGRIGRVLCRHLRRANIDIAVIEKDSELIPVMDADGVLYIAGEAADENNLIKAGIERAKAVIAALATDTDNVFLVLTARQLAPELLIMARSSQDTAKIKLRAAGADFVESPYVMGAVSMAHRIIRPTVTSFLDLAFPDGRNSGEPCV